MNKQQFLALLDKYLKAEASADEEELLFKVYQSFQDKKDWDSNELADIDLLESKMFEKLQKAMRKPADGAINDAGAPSIKYLFVKKLFIAASAVMVITIGLRYMLKPRPQAIATAAQKLVLKNDFKAGGNNAYLVLSNGKKVHLTQAKIGVLARQGGNDIIKKNDGQILYSKSSADATAKDSILTNKIIVPVGGQFKVTLPDGTQVWINSASSLEYPVQFAGAERKIKLSGEAYFEVAKNINKQFVIDVSGKMNVRVFGTHFNVMAYANEAKIATTLLEGSVKVEDLLNPANSVSIVPGQQAEWIKSSDEIKVRAADADEATAWKDGRFLFNNESVYSIMRKLSRWYDVDVIFSKNMKEKSFDGSISRSKNISAVLKLMELTKSVHFKFEGRRIIVMP